MWYDTNMKQAPSYGINGPEVLAFDHKSYEANFHHFVEAKRIWREAWEAAGSPDEGTCTIGKCIRVWFVPKRARIAHRQSIANAEWAQGNVGIARCVQPALDYLAEHGIEATYDDGRMD